MVMCELLLHMCSTFSVGFSSVRAITFFFFFFPLSSSAEYRLCFYWKVRCIRMLPWQSLEYIYLYIICDFFCFWPRLLYLGGVEPVALRARFRCVWVFKGFTAEKLFGLELLRHTSATELCHFWFSTSCRNQRKVQKKSKKYKTKADENRPDWIMSDLAYS